jgi:hypothetical protein
VVKLRALAQARMSTPENEGIPETDWTPFQREWMRDWTRVKFRDRYKQLIADWIERQNQSHNWICLAHIADWCALRPGDIELDQRRRARAYSLLQESTLQGEFHEGGRLRVTNPRSTRQPNASFPSAMQPERGIASSQPAVPSGAAFPSAQRTAPVTTAPRIGVASNAGSAMSYDSIRATAARFSMGRGGR